MKIELVDYKTVRVVLLPQDMEDFCLSYEEMDYKNATTKRAIKLILHSIKQKLALDLTSSQLFIEAFPKEDDGCILYISVLEPIGVIPERKHEINISLAFLVEDINTLTSLCKRIFTQYSHLVLKSSLYLLDEKYILVIKTYSRLDKKLSALALEYANLYGKGEVAISFVKEHASVIVKSGAVEKLVEYLA